MLTTKTLEWLQHIKWYLKPHFDNNSYTMLGEGSLVFFFLKGRHAWNYPNIQSYTSHSHSYKCPMSQQFQRVLLSILFTYVRVFVYLTRDWDQVKEIQFPDFIEREQKPITIFNFKMKVKVFLLLKL